MVHGYWPENHIDHINRDKADNRLCNLREVSNQCNIRNAKVGKNTTTKINGVCPHKRGYEVYIKVNYKKFNLGVFEDFVEAVAHRLAAEQCLDWSGCDTSSSAFCFMQEYQRASLRLTPEHTPHTLRKT